MKLRVGAFCVRVPRPVRELDLISDGKGNSTVRQEAGLDFRTTFTRGCTTGLFSTVPQKARHCSRMTLSFQELIRTGLQHAVSLPEAIDVCLTHDFQCLHRRNYATCSH